MNYLLLFFFLGGTFAFFPIDNIAKINRYKAEAEAAYKAKDYEKAASLYAYLTDSLQVQDPEVSLNLAHAYFQTKKMDEAQERYRQVGGQASAQKTLQSVANQQLGVIAAEAQKIEEALAFFKAALKANPKNQEARHNYELLKQAKNKQDKNKQDKEKKDQDKKDRDKKKDKQDKEKEKNDKNKTEEDKQKEQKDKQKSEEKNKETEKNEEKKEQADKENEQKKNEEEQQKQEEKSKEEKEGQKKDGREKEEEKKEGKEQAEQEQTKEDSQKEREKQQQMRQQRLAEIKMSKEKAEMILNALKNEEIQYYQQLKKKSKKRQQTDKPDW